MSTVTQRIPNLFLGISQQPDNRKFPGQVRDAVNVFPDYALGLLKRPGGRFIADLYNASPTGKFFSILRDDAEKYVGQFANNTFKIWSLLDGSPRTVDMGTNAGVPGTCNYTNVQTALLNYNTAKATTATRLDQLNAAQATYEEALDGQNSTSESLFEVAYNYPYADLQEYVVSGILLSSTGYYTVKVSGVVVSAATTLPAGYVVGAERTNQHPLVAQSGYKLFEVERPVPATHTPAQLSTALTALTTAQNNYNSAVSDEATKKGLYDTQITNCNITTIPSNGYLFGATADDIELLTLNDYTFVLNRQKVVQMKATTVAALPNQAFVVVNVVAYNAKYQVILNGTTFSYTTPATTAAGVADAETIVVNLTNAINASGAYSATVVGPGIYITRATAFTVETRGSTEDDGLYVFQDQITNITRLPTQCRKGYKVKVVNSNEVDIDDMWVEFQTTNSATNGPGTWEETNAPGITYQLDELTMPHQLVRQANGSFKFQPVDWEDRLVGDNNTNPLPSFIGSTIQSLFFYRNRLGFLANEAVILSKAGDYFNFFVTTAMTVSSDDPIDLTASSTKPVTLNYVKTTSVGLVIFGQTEQFLLTTDSDILSPNTAKINTLSNYECDSKVGAVALGTTLAFISKTPLYTRVFELMDINNNAPPFMFDETRVVPELIPSTVNSMISSPGLSMISIGTKGSNTIYQYRFLQQGEKRPLESWYKWELTGNLLDQFFDISTFYATVTDGTKVYVVSMDLTQASEEGFLTLPTGEKTDVCLDMWNINPYRTYNSVADTTRVYLPYNHFTGKTLSVVILGGYIGGSSSVTNQSVGAVEYPTVSSAGGQYYFDLDGDFRGRDLIIGYLYDMTVELPKFYLIKSDNETAASDFTADLIIHRIKVSTGLSGPVTYRINITGIPTWEETVNVTLPNQYVLNSVNIATDAVHNVPLYQRNKNLMVRIVGDTPFPVSLLSLNWEGRYNNGFYKRV
jgi:hypothetical protein